MVDKFPKLGMFDQDQLNKRLSQIFSVIDYAVSHGDKQVFSEKLEELECLFEQYRKFL